MHFERDVIHTKVEPAVNALAMQNNDSVFFSDLRWGIDTTRMDERESAQKVLNVCLNEIDRCQPYMIVLLGYRYGWIPGKNIIRSIVGDKDDFTITDEEISVTELEIEYGALRNPELLKHTIFYFRELDGAYDEVYRPEDLLHFQKLNALKRKITSLPDANVKTYSIKTDCGFQESINKFADMVINDVTELLSSEWRDNAKLDAFEMDQKMQFEQLMLKKEYFVSRFDLLTDCIAEIENKHDNLYIYGESGSGKSTLLSCIGNELLKKGEKVIPVFCGFTKLCSTVSEVIKYMVWILETETGQTEHLEDSEKTIVPNFWIGYLNDLIEKYEIVGQRKLFFLIDGIDQLSR